MTMNNAARAALALEREHLRFQKHPVWGIEARPLTFDNMFVWRVSFVLVVVAYSI